MHAHTLHSLLMKDWNQCWYCGWPPQMINAGICIIHRHQLLTKAWFETVVWHVYWLYADRHQNITKKTGLCSLGNVWEPCPTQSSFISPSFFAHALVWSVKWFEWMAKTNTVWLIVKASGCRSSFSHTCSDAETTVAASPQLSRPIFMCCSHGVLGGLVEGQPWWNLEWI